MTLQHSNRTVVLRASRGKNDGEAVDGCAVEAVKVRRPLNVRRP